MYQMEKLNIKRNQDCNWVSSCSVMRVVWCGTALSSSLLLPKFFAYKVLTEETFKGFNSSFPSSSSCLHPRPATHKTVFSRFFPLCFDCFSTFKQKFSTAWGFLFVISILRRNDNRSITKRENKD